MGFGDSNREMAEPNPNPQAQAEENDMDQHEEREVVVDGHAPKLDEREVEVQEQAPKLKYVGFVQVAAAQAVVCLVGLYELAKDHSGPLRPGVDVTESTVEGVVSPIYRKLHGVPLDILTFVDRKVGDTVDKLDRHLPGPLKAASVVARDLTAEAKQSGIKGAAREAYRKAKGLCVRYEPTAERLAVSTWRTLNSLPLFPQVAHIMVPTAAYCATKYNRVVSAAERQGYTGARYLPTVPTERIAKVFTSSSSEAKGAAETH